MMPILFCGRKYVEGTMYSLEGVYENITKFLDAAENIVSIKYVVSEVCGVEGCQGVVGNRNNCNSRQINYFESAHHFLYVSYCCIVFFNDSR
jgi:hypothetical protein